MTRQILLVAAIFIALFHLGEAINNGKRVPQSWNMTFVVSIEQLLDDGKLNRRSIGVLISDRVVLSSSGWNYWVNSLDDQAYVSLNVHGSKEKRQIIKVARIIRHPGYDKDAKGGRGWHYDLALIFLAQKVVGANIVALPPSNYSISLDSLGSKCIVAGWNITDMQADTDPARTVDTVSLRYAEAPLVSDEECISRMSQEYFHSDTMFCSGVFSEDDGERKGGCNADVGAPYMCQIDNDWYVMGILSQIVGAPCLKTSPNVNTDVAQFVPWIEDTVKLMTSNSQPDKSADKVLCMSYRDKDLYAQNLQVVHGQPFDACCDLCRKAEGCTGYAWNDYLGGSCWLKTGTGPLVDKKGVQSGLFMHFQEEDMSSQVAERTFSYPLHPNSDSIYLDQCFKWATECVSYGSDVVPKTYCQRMGFDGVRSWVTCLADTKTCDHSIFTNATMMIGSNDTCGPYVCGGFKSITCSNHEISCPSMSDNDIGGGNLYAVHEQPFSECCGLCHGEPECKAYAWSDYHGGTCWLKNATGPLVPKDGAKVGFVTNFTDDQLKDIEPERCIAINESCAYNQRKICHEPASYQGNKNTTRSGRTCQRWSATTPHVPHFGSELGDTNFCRNPDKESGPWCYTTDPEKRWELCFEDCLEPDFLTGLIPTSCENTDVSCAYNAQSVCTESDDPLGSYLGMKNTTKSGTVCRKWTDALEHLNSDLLQSLYNGTENYCRNPDRKTGPWCYVGGGNWEMCFEDCPRIQFFSERTIESQAEGKENQNARSCLTLRDKDIDGPFIKSVPYQPFSSCCNLCSKQSECATYAWSNKDGGTCWLQKEDPKQSLKIRQGWNMGVMGSHSEVTETDDIDDEPVTINVDIISGFIGGKPTRRDEYEWVVSLVDHTDSSNQHLCTGAVISSDFILTAAYCFFKEESKKERRNMTALRISKGKELYKIDSVFLHPGFVPSSGMETRVHHLGNVSAMGYDVALVLLAESERTWIPIPISNSTVIDPTALCVVVGWGTDHYNSTMQYASAPLVSDCAKVWPGLTDSMLCVGDYGEKKKGACADAVGAPLVCMENSLWHLVGVSSFGSYECLLKPGVFTNVRELGPWMAQNGVVFEDIDETQDHTPVFEMTGLFLSFLGIVVIIVMAGICILYRRGFSCTAVFSVQNFPRISKDQIKTMDKIGEGNFCEVWKGSYQPTGSRKSITVAVKFVKVTAGHREMKQFLEEAFILDKLKGSFTNDVIKF